ncbi:hypothetical protein Poly41_32480 [Novipirellula artificiosorum]|uniref:Uncharacterized protein n=1 Tax=Novipirellula artificiosorum TaxID=2528016 RepID=A0A5C6DN89_9BACT|nr:hypothetical protein Poly41_32480 [Novipirellula artificiosorum]
MRSRWTIGLGSVAGSVRTDLPRLALGLESDSIICTESPRLPCWPKRFPRLFDVAQWIVKKQSGEGSRVTEGTEGPTGDNAPVMGLPLPQLGIITSFCHQTCRVCWHCCVRLEWMHQQGD